MLYLLYALLLFNLVFKMCLVLESFWSFFISEKQRKVAEYYKQQERLLEGYNDMDTMTETGLFPGSLTEVDYIL